MILQEIIDKCKPSGYFQSCTRRGVNRWDLAEYLGTIIYNSKKGGISVNTRICKKCGIEFSLRSYKGKIFIYPMCRCMKLNHVSIDYFLCFLDLEDAKKEYEFVNKKKRKGLSNTLEFYEDSGLSDSEIKKEIKRIQISRSKQSPSTKTGAREYSGRCAEYWMKKGLSEEESKEKVRFYQTHNGLDWYISKYGDKIGEEKFCERMNNWLSHPNNKKMSSNRSLISLDMFDKIGVGIYGNNEKVIRIGKKNYRVDFIYGNKIIEFYGDYWHANPTLYNHDSQIRKKKATDIWMTDKKKISELETKFDVMIVWEADYRKDSEQVLNNIKIFINEN